jgi:hypothetical protein
MIPADNPALRLLALEQLIDAVHSERWQELLDAGIKPQTLDRLRRTPLEDAALVAARGEVRVNFSIDGDSLEQGLNRVARQRADEAIKEYFVRHNATPVLLQRLFKLDRPTMDRLRRMFGANSRGRPPLPRPAERDAVHARWREISAAESDPRQRYLKLHEAFPHHDIRVLEAVLKEFED